MADTIVRRRTTASSRLRSCTRVWTLESGGVLAPVADDW